MSTQDCVSLEQMNWKFLGVLWGVELIQFVGIFFQQKIINHVADQRKLGISKVQFSLILGQLVFFAVVVDTVGLVSQFVLLQHFGVMHDGGAEFWVPFVGNILTSALEHYHSVNEVLELGKLLEFVRLEMKK